MKKIPAFVFALILLACQSVFSKDSSSGSENLERGYDAYKMEDWTSAVFTLKKQWRLRSRLLRKIISCS